MLLAAASCCFLPAACCLLFAACCLLLPLVVCCLLPAACYLLLFSGCWLLAAGCWLLVAGCWLLLCSLLLLLAAAYYLFAAFWVLDGGHPASSAVSCSACVKRSKSILTAAVAWPILTTPRTCETQCAHHPTSPFAPTTHYQICCVPFTISSHSASPIVLALLRSRAATPSALTLYFTLRSPATPSIRVLLRLIVPTALCGRPRYASIRLRTISRRPLQRRSRRRRRGRRRNQQR